MTAPAQAALQFVQGLGLGVGLGILYGSLRPLRRRRAIPADLVFMVAAFWAWLQLSFGICRGDIRLGTTSALALGALAWELTAGRLLRRPIALFWQTVGQLMALLFRPLKYFLQIIQKFRKKVFIAPKRLLKNCVCKLFSPNLKKNSNLRWRSNILQMKKRLICR